MWFVAAPTGYLRRFAETMAGHVARPWHVNHLGSSLSLATIATSVYLSSPSSHGSRFCMACSRLLRHDRSRSGRARVSKAKQTSPIQAKNSLYPVSVGCGTRLVTSFVLFWWRSKLTFSTEPRAVRLQRFQLCFCHFISEASATRDICNSLFVVWTGLWARGGTNGNIRGI